MYVKDVRHYKTLDKYIKTEDWTNIAPHTGSNKSTRDAYESIIMKNGIPVFSDERVSNRGGICAIELTPSLVNNIIKNKKQNDETFLPLNKILKYNTQSVRKTPQTLNQCKRQFNSISKTQTIQIKSSENKMYTFKAYSHIDLSKTVKRTFLHLIYYFNYRIYINYCQIGSDINTGLNYIKK